MAQAQGTERPRQVRGQQVPLPVGEVVFRQGAERLAGKIGAFDLRNEEDLPAPAFDPLVELDVLVAGQARVVYSYNFV